MKILYEFLYRIMIGLTGFSLGLALMLCYHNVKVALKDDKEQWFWAGARLAYVLIVFPLLPLIFVARRFNYPFNWQSWSFLAGVLLEVVCFSGILLMRHRGTHSKPPKAP